MRKDLGSKVNFLPLPVLIIGTYDENYLDENGNIDVEKMQIITFDMISNTYRVLGDVVGNAFKDGLEMK